MFNEDNLSTSNNVILLLCNINKQSYSCNFLYTYKYRYYDKSLVNKNIILY